MDVGRLLRQAREGAGLSQAELAARGGVAQPVLSRFETGVRTPSLAVLDRLLAGCGLELDGQLVPRRLELAELLDRLAARDVLSRLSGETLPSSVLHHVLEHGCDVLVGGGWAALALGLPVQGVPEGRLVLDASQAGAFVRGTTAVHRTMQPRRWVDGEPAGWPITEDLFAPGSRHRWSHRLAGDFETVVLRDGEGGPPEERVRLDGRVLRVVAASALTPEDGVPLRVREAFLAWREARRAAT